MHRQQAQLVIDNPGGSGESPVWDATRRRLAWVDNHACRINTLEPRGDGTWGEGPSWSPGRMTGAPLPMAGGGFAIPSGLEVYTLAEDGTVASLVTLDADPYQLFFNDAHCDPVGRMWVGTSATDFKSPRGGLWCIDAQGKMKQVADDIAVSNGMDWSPDRKTFYFVDSAPRLIYAYDCDLPSATISNRRVVVSMAKGDIPDGMFVDAEGCICVAVFGGGEVRRYAPDGALVGAFELPVTGATACAIGGDDLDELFITTLGCPIPPDSVETCGLTIEQAAQMIVPPGAGGVFSCKVPFRGQPGQLFGAAA